MREKKGIQPYCPSDPIILIKKLKSGENNRISSSFFWVLYVCVCVCVCLWEREWDEREEEERGEIRKRGKEERGERRKEEIEEREKIIKNKKHHIF